MLTILVDYVYKTTVDVEAFNETHILISYDKIHAINRTSSGNLPSGYFHKFMEFVQQRRDGFASVINLCDYQFTVPQLRVLYGGLRITPLSHSVDRLSPRESVAKFERILRLAEILHETNNYDYKNRHIKFRPKSF